MTGRLRLDPVVAADLDDLYALHSDPGVWQHLPSGRHTSRQQTAEFIARRQQEWQSAGLGYWTVRLTVDLTPDLAAGSVVGIGGCAMTPGGWWNLYYRFTPASWGHGLAAELVTAARAAAAAVAPDAPVIAYLLEHNAGSRRVAERSGLTLVWRGPDAGNSDPTAVRLVFADRLLADGVLAQVAATP